MYTLPPRNGTLKFPTLSVSSASVHQFQPSPDAARLKPCPYSSKYIHTFATKNKTRSVARGRRRSQLRPDTSDFRSASSHLFYVEHTAIGVADSTQTQLCLKSAGPLPTRDLPHISSDHLLLLLQRKTRSSCIRFDYLRQQRSWPPEKPPAQPWDITRKLQRF